MLENHRSMLKCGYLQIKILGFQCVIHFPFCNTSYAKKIKANEKRNFRLIGIGGNDINNDPRFELLLELRECLQHESAGSSTKAPVSITDVDFTSTHILIMSKTSISTI